MQSAVAADMKSSDIVINDITQKISMLDKNSLAKMDDLSLIQKYLASGGDPNLRNASGIPLIFTALHMALNKNPIALDYLKCFRNTKVNVNITFDYFDEKYHAKEIQVEEAKAYIAKLPTSELQINANNLCKVFDYAYTLPIGWRIDIIWRHFRDFIKKEFNRLLPLLEHELVTIASHPSRLIRIRAYVNLLNAKKVGSYNIEMYQETYTPIILQIAICIVNAVDESVKETLWLLFDELTSFHAVDLNVTDPNIKSTILHLMTSDMCFFSEKEIQIRIKVIDRMFEKGAGNLMDKINIYFKQTPISRADSTLLRIWSDITAGNQSSEKRIALQNLSKAFFIILEYLKYKERIYKEGKDSQAECRDEKKGKDNVLKMIREKAEHPLSMIKYQLCSAIMRNDDKAVENLLTNDVKILQHPFYIEKGIKCYLHEMTSGLTNPVIRKMLYKHVLPELLNEYIESFAFAKKYSEHNYAPAGRCIAASIIIRFKTKTLFQNNYISAVYNFLRIILLPDGFGFIDNDKTIFTGVLQHFQAKDKLDPEQARVYIANEMFGYHGNSQADQHEQSGCIITIHPDYLDNIELFFSAFRKKLRELAPNIPDKSDAKCTISPTIKLFKSLMLKEKIDFTQDEIKSLYTIQDHRGLSFLHMILFDGIYSEKPTYFLELLKILSNRGMNFNFCSDNLLPILIYFIWLINNLGRIPKKNQRQLYNIFGLLLESKIDTNAKVVWDYRIKFKDTSIGKFYATYDNRDKPISHIRILYNITNNLSIPNRCWQRHQGLRTILSTSIDQKMMNSSDEAYHQVVNEATALIASIPEELYEICDFGRLFNMSAIHYLNVNRFHGVPAVQMLLKIVIKRSSPRIKPCAQYDMLHYLLKDEKTNLHDVDPVTFASLLHLVALLKDDSPMAIHIIDLLMMRGLGYNFTISDAFGRTPLMIANEFKSPNRVIACLQRREEEELNHRNTTKILIDFFEAGMSVNPSIEEKHDHPLPKTTVVPDTKVIAPVKSNCKTLAEKRADSLVLMKIPKGNFSLFRDFYSIFSGYISNSFNVFHTTNDIRLVGASASHSTVPRLVRGGE